MTSVRRLFAVVLGVGLVLSAMGSARVVADAIAKSDYYQVLEDHELVVDAPGVLGNDDTSNTPKFGWRLCVGSWDGLSGLIHKRFVGWPSGAFDYQPPDDWFGGTVLLYTASDYFEGETCPPGPGPSAANLYFDVIAVNDPPVALLKSTCKNGLQVAEDSGPFDDPDYCAYVSSFGPNEGGSLSEWIVTTDRPELFSAGPVLTATGGRYGKLAFTPAPGASGSATVSVVARDDGGTANGGADTSVPIQFPITITPGPTPSPTASPTARPTASPTARATPGPTPSSTAPSTAAPASPPSATPSPGGSAAVSPSPVVPGSSLGSAPPTDGVAAVTGSASPGQPSAAPSQLGSGGSGGTGGLEWLLLAVSAGLGLGLGSSLVLWRRRTTGDRPRESP